MKNSIYDYDDYKSYIIEKIDSSPSKGRGVKLKISASLNCHTAFVSQVLNGQLFILFLLFVRAVSVELKDFF